MRVMVSGAQRDVTSCVTDELIRRGHEVAAITDHAAVDALVHVLGHADRGDGVSTAGAEAGRRGIPRLVLISPTAPGSSRIDLPGSSTLLVRTPDVLGRTTTGATRRRFAGPVVIGAAGQANRVQFIHHDDLARFVADALQQPRWSGQVSLAADDAMPLRDVAAILGKPYVELHPVLRSAIRHLPGTELPELGGPLLDTTGVRESGFVPAWSGRDCVADFHRANRQHLYLGGRRVSLPWRFPWTPTPPPRRDGPQRRAANESGLSGEFDTTIDPRWPEFTCANIAEAFPGPMTPLSLELAMEAMRATGLLAADIVQMTGALRRAVTEEHVGCFGHTVYVNLTVSREASTMLPGADPAAWRDFLFGTGSGLDDPDSPDNLDSGRIALWGMARRLPKIITLLGNSGREARRIEAEARQQQRDADYYASRTDDELRSQLAGARDATVSSWTGAALGSAGVVPIMALIERWGGKRLASQFRGGIDNLASAGLIRATYDLADRAGADPSVMRALRGTGAPDASNAGEALQRLGVDHPGFAAGLDAIIAEYGHRGPSETELSCPVFADTPGWLIDAVVKLAESDERPAVAIPWINPGLRLLGRLGAGFQQSRERARDAAMRYTHNYRLIVRELGSRLAAGGIIERADDVFYLTRDELTHPPDDATQRVSRRRAERVRLQQHRPPTSFTGRWDPRRNTTGELRPGDSMTGIPASAGSAKGPVRILTVNSLGDLQPGEVLVAECTDTGWTPFFSYAAAVVVDTGAEMSHAAVIAREFGIPCVMGSLAASRVLRSGQVVEVDGSTGRITRLE